MLRQCLAAIHGRENVLLRHCFAGVAFRSRSVRQWFKSVMKALRRHRLAVTVFWLRLIRQVLNIVKHSLRRDSFVSRVAWP